ncbi:MAG: hypothetical protein LBQ94_09735 [Treponema sp.]|nr:hypothetical protein [Treponema sp.]
MPGTPTGVTAARISAGSTDVRVSWNAVAYGNGRWVAVGTQGKMVYCDW